MPNGGLQVRRAGALAVTKAVADQQQLEMLDLDANEIPDSAIDDIKVRHLTYALLLEMAPPPPPGGRVFCASACCLAWKVVQQSSSVLTVLTLHVMRSAEPCCAHVVYTSCPRHCCPY